MLRRRRNKCLPQSFPRAPLLRTGSVPCLPRDTRSLSSLAWRPYPFFSAGCPYPDLAARALRIASRTVSIQCIPIATNAAQRPTDSTLDWVCQRAIGTSTASPMRTLMTSEPVSLPTVKSHPPPLDGNHESIAQTRERLRRLRHALRWLSHLVRPPRKWGCAGPTSCAARSDGAPGRSDPARRRGGRPLLLGAPGEAQVGRRDEGPVGDALLRGHRLAGAPPVDQRHHQHGLCAQLPDHLGGLHHGRPPRHGVLG